MKYHYRAVERFWTSFYRLPSAQKDSARKAWKIFKQNPFDPRLRTHKIHRLSAHYGWIIYAAEIEGDLRLLFYLDDETVVSLIIGTHDVYKNQRGCDAQAWGVTETLRVWKLLTKL